MTVGQIHIHESNLIEGIDDQIADACGIAAWHWLQLHDQVTEPVILELHRIVTASQRSLRPGDKGTWRSTGVRVGDYIAPPAGGVPGLMSTWCYALHLCLTSAEGAATPFTPRELHVGFEKVHPFVDGNGRVGRLLLWWHEVRLGQEPTFLRAATRDDYYAWFQTEGASHA